ncbi:glutathione peroxidase [Polaribacter sp. HL-MS24]|uniref:glutathione peroxidase n=1 Tax=Polaribacter sp. HL-MS24 TaxID=3077735 RepID=UPI002934935E|nr:glutathione peroxidase [Polaribacter sp. HL-MS24]WOC41063.1 glutathione peroxidase [Polaribacter sp. HL-MS24]
MKKIIWSILFLSFFSTSAQNSTTTNSSIYDIKIEGIDGEIIDLHQYKGKKIMFVNVASECGFTYQYDGLQELYDKYKEQLVVIGLPCNQFGGQEPGSTQEIQTFCRLNYGVNFPLTEKIKVKGKQQHELYQWLTMKQKNGKRNSSVKWNFQKYLIDENGALMDVFYSMTKPMSAKITKLIELH